MSICWKDKCSSVSCGKKEEGIKTKATPLPWGKLLVVYSVFFAHQVGIHMLFPFLPYMVRSFFPDLDRAQIGQKAGYLAATYYIGNFISSLFWGWLADVLGRRPALIGGLCGILFSEVFFAFSQNFAWAVAARFLWGVLNGNVGITKTVVSDICDDSNQARGFAMLGVSRGVGSVVGSTIGGFLSQPASKYSALQSPVFCLYPYSLPVLVAAVLAFASLFGVWLFLDEPIERKKKLKSSRTPSLSPEDPRMSPLTSDPTANSDTEMVVLTKDDDVITQDDVIGSQALLVAENDMDADDCEMERVSSGTELLVRKRQLHSKWPCLPSCNPLYPCIKFKERVVNCVATPIQIFRFLNNTRHQRSWSPRQPFNRGKVLGWARQVCGAVKKRARLMADRRVFFSTLMYGLFALIAVMNLELIPLLLVTSHKDGGYSLDDNELGLIFMVSVGFELLFQLLIYPKTSKLLGFRNTLRLGAFLFIIICIVLPFSNQITGPVPPTNVSLPSNTTSGNGISDEFCDESPTGNFTFSSVNVNSIQRVPASIWILLIFVNGMAVISRNMTFTSVMVMINNSSVPSTKGMVNGIGQALAALGRSIGPAIGAPLFAWSEGTGRGWPLNFHFVFDLMAISSVVIILLSLFLPKSIENKREAPPPSTPPLSLEPGDIAGTLSNDQDMSPLLNDRSSVETPLDNDDSITKIQLVPEMTSSSGDALTFDTTPSGMNTGVE